MSSTIRSIINSASTAYTATQAGTSNASGLAAVAAPGGKLGKNEFLKLLTVQMRYQDPMDPMDGKQMAADLAQFSGLEQLLNINEQLAAQQGQYESLVQTMNNSVAMNAIGRNVIIVRPLVGLQHALAELIQRVGKASQFTHGGRTAGRRCDVAVGVGVRHGQRIALVPLLLCLQLRRRQLAGYFPLSLLLEIEQALQWKLEHHALTWPETPARCISCNSAWRVPSNVVVSSGRCCR